jgi:hypothetical protein
MVMAVAALIQLGSWLLLAAPEVARKIPEPTRTIVIMALLGIALVGMLLIAGTMLAGHWVRRQGNFRRGPVVPKDTIVPRSAPSADRSELNGQSTSETFSGDDTVGTDDTVIS